MSVQSFNFHSQAMVSTVLIPMFAPLLWDGTDILMTRLLVATIANFFEMLNLPFVIFSCRLILPEFVLYLYSSKL